VDTDAGTAELVCGSRDVDASGREIRNRKRDEREKEEEDKRIDWIQSCKLLGQGQIRWFMYPVKAKQK